LRIEHGIHLHAKQCRFNSEYALRLQGCGHKKRASRQARRGKGRTSPSSPLP
jgi:hypothetical protein